MAVKRSTATNDKKLISQQNAVSKGTTNTSIGSRPYSSPNTTTNTPKVTSTATATASKGTANSIGTRPYSSPNTSSANQGVTAVNKGTGYTSLPYTTPNASAYNQAYTAPSAPVSNPIRDIASSLSNAANNAAPYASVVGLASGSVNPSPDTSNITPSISTPSSNTGNTGSLWDAVVKSNTIGGTANTQAVSNVLGNTTAAHNAATRPYSNPNFDYEDEKYGSESNTITSGGGGHHSFDVGQDIESPLGKANTKAVYNLLDTLSNEGIPGYDVPYSSPNADTSNYISDVIGDTTKTGDTNINYGGGGGTRASGTSSGLGGYDAGGIDISALYDLLDQRLADYDGNYTSLLDLLANNYGDLLNALGLNYSDTEALLNGQFTNSKNELEAARRRALQEAYISRMMQEKNLADQLDAYGLSGGAAESVMANMRNNYANNRNAVEENLQNNLRQLLQQYLENLAGARDRYNNSLMNAQTNRFNALVDAAQTRSNQRDNAIGDLYNTLANLTMKGINYGR